MTSGGDGETGPPPLKARTRDDYLAMIEPARTANKAVYMAPETEKLMVPPEMVGNDIRRVRTRLFTSFKTGL